MSWIPSPGDADAIHDNVAGEIAALTEKETPVDADLILIEDSQDGNAKKKVQVGNLPGGGGGGGGENASYAETIGDNSNTSFQVTHDLGTQDLVVQLWDLTGAEPVEATADADSIEIDDDDNITVTFSMAPAEDAYRVVILASGGSGGGGGGGSTDAIRGTATIDNGETTKDVVHGVGSRPRRGEIQASPANQDAAESDWWLSDFGANTFRINVATTPTTSAEWDWLYVRGNAAPVLSAYVEAVLVDEPAHYWRFEEQSGTSIEDQVGGADLTLVSSPDLGLDGAVGSAIGFDGTNHAVIPVGVPTQPFPLTIEFWMRTESTLSRFFFGVLGGGIMLAGMINGDEGQDPAQGKTMFMIRNSNSGPSYTRWSIAESGMYDGEWHHVVVAIEDARDDTMIVTYVDGQSVSQTFERDNFSGTSWSPSASLFLGRINDAGGGVDDNPAVIDLDEWAFYYDVLDSGQVAAHYAAASE